MTPSDRGMRENDTTAAKNLISFMGFIIDYGPYPQPLKPAQETDFNGGRTRART